MKTRSLQRHQIGDDVGEFFLVHQLPEVLLHQIGIEALHQKLVGFKDGFGQILLGRVTLFAFRRARGKTGNRWTDDGLVGFK